MSRNDRSREGGSFLPLENVPSREEIDRDQEAMDEDYTDDEDLDDDDELVDIISDSGGYLEVIDRFGVQSSGPGRGDEREGTESNPGFLWASSTLFDDTEVGGGLGKGQQYSQCLYRDGPEIAGSRDEGTTEGESTTLPSSFPRLEAPRYPLLPEEGFRAQLQPPSRDSGGSSSLEMGMQAGSAF